MKFNLHRRNVNEKSWNDTENFLATILCTQFSRKKDQFAHNIERVHRENYKNPNSPIYAKFLSWKVAQGVLKPTGRVSAPYSPVKSTLKKCNIEWTHYFWKKKGIQRRSVQKNREELHYVSGSIDGEKANIDEKD